MICELFFESIVEVLFFDLSGEKKYFDILRGFIVVFKIIIIVGNILLFKLINDDLMYFVLLKYFSLFGMLIFRNFYWLYFVGGSYI